MKNAEHDAWQRLAERIVPGSSLLDVSELTGGVSAQTTAIELAHPDGVAERLVVRMHGEVDRAANPQIARDEFRLLELLKQQGLAVPAPRFLDDSCRIFPLPLLAIEFIDGSADAAPSGDARFAAQAARELARIHTLRDAPQLAFLPRQRPVVPAPGRKLDSKLGEERIREALDSHLPARQINSNTLLHGDYWPGNLLWNDGQLVAVIDWEDARVGDPLADLANARLEIHLARGRKTMERFTAGYVALTDIDTSNLAWWDLLAALHHCGRMEGWGLDKRDLSRFTRRHTRFVDRAIERLPH